MVKTRNLAFVSLGAGCILAEILLQRKIELWVEVFRYTDNRRLKLLLDGIGSNHDSGTAIKMSLPAESDAFLFRIPQAEFAANKA